MKKDTEEYARRETQRKQAVQFQCFDLEHRGCRGAKNRVEQVLRGSKIRTSGIPYNDVGI